MQPRQERAPLELTQERKNDLDGLWWQSVLRDLVTTETVTQGEECGERVRSQRRDVWQETAEQLRPVNLWGLQGRDE